MNKLVEVKVFEPACGGLFPHGDRYRFVNCWLQRTSVPNSVKVQTVGSEGCFDFVDGYCSDFWGDREAWIVGEIDRSRSSEADRFSLEEEDLASWRTTLKT